MSLHDPGLPRLARSHKKIFGVVGTRTRPPFGMGLDHRYLAFFQYTTGYPFSTYDEAAYDPIPSSATSASSTPRAAG